MTSAPYPATGAGDVDELLGNAYRTVLEVRDNLPLLESIQTSLTDIATVADNLNGVEGAILANHVAVLLAGMQNYRATFAEALTDFAVGAYFTSIQSGTLRLYKRTAVAPYYEDQGDSVAPVTRSMFSAISGAALIGVASGGTLADKLVALDAEITALELGVVSADEAAVALDLRVTDLENAPAPSEGLPTVRDTGAIVTGAFSPDVSRVATRGFNNPNDGGAATYTRWVTGMVALPSGGQGIWWFTASDGSKWQMAKASEHMAAQFGALGGSGIDARPILNAALASDQVSVVNLGALTHYITGATTGAYSVLKPSGKGLRGINRAVSWVKLVPVTLGTQANAIQTIYCEDDDGGFFEDFSLDCQRSGVGGVNNDRVSGVTIRAKAATGKGTRVRRVNVYNATGYGHYESADASRKLRDILREDCQSYNCGVGHESSGDVEVTSIDPYCHSDSGNVWDGGAVINTEAMYHDYGNILKVHRIRARGYGHCGAGIYPSGIAGSANLRRVIYEEPDIEVLSAVPGLQADGTASYKVEWLEVIGGRIISAGTGVSCTHVTAGVVRGTKITGGLGGSGAGVIVSTGATVDLYEPDVTGTGSGGVAAIGVSQQGTGVLRWHGGGKLTATGGSAQNPVDGTVTFVDGTGPVVSPVQSVWARPVSYLWSETWVKQTGADGAVNIIANGTDADGNYVYWVSQVLDPVPNADGSGHWYPERIDHEFSWRAPYASNITTIATIKADILWTQRDNANVGLTITTKQAIPSDARLIWTMRERPA